VVYDILYTMDPVNHEALVGHSSILTNKHIRLYKINIDIL